MPKREFLMLAHDFDPKKHSVYGWYMSEKLDGIRAFWDGGISRGLPASQVPYANITKHDRFLVPPKATGLWTRYGQPIQAPEWWLDRLPNFPLDGELKGKDFQETMSIARTTVKTSSVDWNRITYWCFDVPSLERVFEDGRIINANMKCTFKGCYTWAFGKMEKSVIAGNWYYERLAFLQNNLDGNVAKTLLQETLPTGRTALDSRIEAKLAEVIAAGGEGVMLRSPVSTWHPFRSYDLLKLKAENDMEGTVIGYTWGKATDVDRSVSGEATDRMLGLMGSVRLQLESGVVFDLGCGFKIPERVMAGGGTGFFAPQQFGADHPGQEVPESYENPLFKRGAKLTFKYRELTRDGVPKEARFWRVCEREL